jgi:O-acetylhomoserine (thiol)-lyase
MSQEKNYHLETMAIHGGFKFEPTTRAEAVPIFQTVAYGFDSTEHAEKIFALQADGHIYTRMSNPTTEVFEKRVAMLEGGVGALATASGQAAITLSILNIVNCGEEVVSSNSLYGGTFNLFKVTLPKLGIKVNMVNAQDPENFRKAITPKTRAIYADTIGNPGMEIIDIEAVAKIAHENGIPLILDNTFATPYLCRPFDWGADIVVHSASKYICGNGTSIGGIVIDSGNFDWTSGKFPSMTEPDPGYHNLSYAHDIGKAAYITKLRTQLLRDFGAPLSPFNAFLYLLGLETLHLRVQRQIDNALKVARYLENHPAVDWVNYPSLPSNKFYDLAQKYLSKGAGAVFTFGIKGGRKAGAKFIDSVQLFSHLANLGEVRSLVVHPASTTHSQLSPEEQLYTGVTPDMVRISLGVENIEDLINDLEQALANSQKY